MANTFNNASVKLTTTSITDIYQAPTSSGNVGIVLSIIAANVNGTSSADITLTKTDSSDTAQSIIAFTIPIPSDTSMEMIPNKLVLKAGEKIRATASSANYIDITLSVLEIV